MTLHSPPRITHVTLRRGTRYRVIEPDGVSESHVLERDAEVEVRHLAFEPQELATYVIDGDVLLVAYEDEVRGPRTT